MSFEVNGTRGALSWDFQRLNELQLYRTEGVDRGYKTVHAAPGMGDFANFQPGAGISMGYDDLKVAEAERFLSSIAEGRDRGPSIQDIVSTMRVVDAMDRSCETGSWERVGEATGAAATAGERRMRGRRVSGPDLVCIGRTSVDLYAEQDGSKLEDVQSFRKYVGGSATNIAVGTARLGVKSAMLTRVGEEQMGRFVRKTLADNGVDVSQVRPDPEKLTPYVLLAVRAIEDFPRLFAYGDAADLAIEEEDVDPDFIASSRALLVTGTPLSRPKARAASVKAVEAARRGGTKVAFDLDYRPVFWGWPPTSRAGRCSSPARG